MIVTLFDTETTGLIKPSSQDIDEQPYITEIYVLKVRQEEGKLIEIVDEFESYIKPPVPISAEITKITGISDETVKDAPSFAEVYNKLSHFVTGADRLVAHNLAFDRAMLANELVRIDKVLRFPWPRLHMCTVEQSMKYEQRRLSLTRLHEYLFAKGFPNAHRAKGDVVAMFSCYKRMVEMGDIV
jgi:DNA polymerase III epsilon subunit-like protein